MEVVKVENSGYNAVNGTAYDDPEAIWFNTIGRLLYFNYFKMKNDTSFIIIFLKMNLWEHQRAFTPNMPIFSVWNASV